MERSGQPQGEGRIIQHTFSENPRIGRLDVHSLGDKRTYMHNGKIVYTSDQNNLGTYTTFEDFLYRYPKKRVRFAKGKPADVAIFGTININLDPLPGQAKATDWMGQLEESFRVARVSVANPNLGSTAQLNGINMEQFSRESQNLFEGKVIAMNFESRRGGLSLAELRMAMLASILTGHRLYVRMESPTEDRDTQRSRAVAKADIAFFQKQFGDRLPMTFYDMDKNPISLVDFVGEIKKAVEGKTRRQRLKRLPILHKRVAKEDIVLSGSSASPLSMAMRLEIKEQLVRQGKAVADTYDAHFDSSSQNAKVRMAHIQGRRVMELERMAQATDHIIYAGDSFSPFAQLATALLFTALNGSKIRALVLNPAIFDPRGQEVQGSYEGGTSRSHLAKMTANRYQLFKFASLLDALTVRTVAPGIARSIKVLSDTIQPLVASFSTRRR